MKQAVVPAAQDNNDLPINKVKPDLEKSVEIIDEPEKKPTRRRKNNAGCLLSCCRWWWAYRRISSFLRY